MGKLNATANSAIGKMRQETGKVLENQMLEAKGEIQKDKGDRQMLKARLKKSIHKTAYKVGHAIKKFGNQIENLGD